MEGHQRPTYHPAQVYYDFPKAYDEYKFVSNGWLDFLPFPVMFWRFVRLATVFFLPHNVLTFCVTR
jgi:hypothetical protein